MKSIILSLLLLAVSSPAASALTVEQAKELGMDSGIASCNAVWNGARTYTELLMTTEFNPRKLKITTWIHSLKKTHPLNKAYWQGYHEGIEPCRKQLVKVMQTN